MTRLMNFPAVIFALSVLVLWISGRIGTSFRNKRKDKSDDAATADFGLVLASTLTLLGLIIRFTFSMAVLNVASTLNAVLWARVRFKGSPQVGG